MSNTQCDCTKSTTGEDNPPGEQLTLSVTTETAMERLAGSLAQLTNGSGVIFLSGQLGAGKTTFCRGVIRYFGHTGAVKSPTFTLVEPYEIGDTRIFHLDLYRLGHPEELEYIGLEDYVSDRSLCLIEWPEKGADLLPSGDVSVEIMLPDHVRGGCESAMPSEQREMTLVALSSRGKEMLGGLRHAVRAQAAEDSCRTDKTNSGKLPT